jgi:CHAT domain-containing protein
LRGKSLILAALLFLLSMGIPVIAAQVTVLSPTEAIQIVKQGKEYYQAGQFEEAATYWQQAVESFAAQGDTLNQAMALSNLSLTVQQLGKWEEAEQSITASLSLLKTQTKTPEQQRILASTLDIQGQLQLAVGQSNAALETWQRAADLYAQLGEWGEVKRSQIDRAQAMQSLGLYPRACTTLLKALDLDSQNCKVLDADLQILKTQPADSLTILGLRSFGNVLRVIGQTEASQKILLIARQFAQQLEDSKNLAAIDLSLGNTARALGNRKILVEFRPQPVTLTESVPCTQETTDGTATAFYQQAVTCYRQAELSFSPITKVQAQLNLLNLFVQTQQWSEVAPLLSKIPSNLDALQVSRTAVYAQLKWAQGLMCLKSEQVSSQSDWSSPILQQCSLVKDSDRRIDSKSLQTLQTSSWQEISQRVTQALNQARSLRDNQAEANTLGYLGGVYQQMGRLAEAQRFTEQALQKLSAFNTPEIAYLWQWQLGRLYQAQGDRQNALRAYTLAFEILRTLRRDLAVTSSDIQFTFRDSVEPVYRELVDLLLRSDNPSQDNLNQARDIIEALQLEELNNFFREACLDAHPQPIDQIDPKAAVIYPIILPKYLAVIVSLPGQPLLYYKTALVTDQDDREANEIERVYDDLFPSLNPFISDPNPLRAEQQFYDWLLRPAEAELERHGIRTLVFVLDGLLRGVPLAALHDGRQYLIEKYNLALTPGLQLLNPRSFSSERLRILMGGLAEARQGFPPLPGVKQEVKEISQVVSTKVLLDRDFTSAHLQKEIETVSFPIVHLATHGQFSSQAEDTFLLTWDERINVKELDRLLQERDRRSPNPIELLILSACQTATGDKRAALGLAGVAVRSGARSTIATLWSIQDRSTADLMTQFYLKLSKPGTTKAEALRQAQLSLLRSPQYQHPFYWAPFVLVGNWL